MRVGFLVWNRFQVAHFAEIARQFADPDLIQTARHKLAWNGFEPGSLIALRASSRFVQLDHVDSLDGEYDVIVFPQSIRPLAATWVDTRIVMHQYSLAKPKAAYNARWFLADLGLVYGDYSESIISAMCPTAKVGNPRFDPYFEDRLNPDYLQQIRGRLDPSKKTVLYLPTWGDLNSTVKLSRAIAGLSQHYNIIYKPHHNTLLYDWFDHDILAETIVTIDSPPDIPDTGPYLFKVSDVVVSDMSGAIFDALYCGKPVVLLGDPGLDYVEHGKADDSGLEVAERESIGPLVTEPDGLMPAIERMLGYPHPYAEANERMVKRCFVQRGGCAALAARSIRELVAAEPQRPRLQLYVAPHIRSLMLRRSTRVKVSRIGRLRSRLMKMVAPHVRRNRFLYALYLWARRRRDRSIPHFPETASREDAGDQKC